MGFLTREAATYWPLLVFAGLVLAVDQASKALVLGTTRQGMRSGRVRGRMPRVRVCLNRSAGIALLSIRYAIPLWGTAFVGTILLVHFMPALQGWATQVGLGIALGGAIGNLLDLARRGAVVDFIDLRIWPIFNVADACIVVGAGATLWSIG
jgi:signal peptidase II